MDILLLGLAAAMLGFAAVEFAQLWALLPLGLIFVAMVVRQRRENKEKEEKEDL